MSDFFHLTKAAKETLCRVVCISVCAVVVCLNELAFVVQVISLCVYVSPHTVSVCVSQPWALSVIRLPCRSSVYKSMGTVHVCLQMCECVWVRSACRPTSRRVSDTGRSFSSQTPCALDLGLLKKKREEDYGEYFQCYYPVIVPGCIIADLITEL